MDFHYWLAFIATLVGISLIPGPSTLIAFAHGAELGWQKSSFTALGNSAASTLQATAASTGLGIAITSSAGLFMAIKYIGAVYLVFMGIQMWRSATKRVSLDADQKFQRTKGSRLFMSGFTIAISNPKAIAFFTALFPQFLSPNGNSFSQLVIMVFIVTVIAFFMAFFYGILGAWLRDLELSKRAMAKIYKSTGGLFVASGLALIFTASKS